MCNLRLALTRIDVQHFDCTYQEVPRMSEVPDSIERTITIDRDAGTVYALIATPGWWINEGSITANQVTTVDDISMVTHDKYGTFRIRTIARRPPHRSEERRVGKEGRSRWGA